LPNHHLFPYTTLFRSQTEAASAVPHLVLCELTHREAGRGELLLSERPEKIGLILAPVFRPQEQMAARRGIARDARVVAGRDGRRSEEHTSELQSRFDL